MARAMWKGAIQFGLVTIPVKLYLATESKGISFNMLHKTDLSRIQMKVWCPVEDEPISRSDTVKGFEYAPGEYVVVTDEDLERVPLKTVRSIEIEQFTKAERDDAAVRFVKSAYYLEPDKVGRKAFNLLKSVLAEDGLTAICKVVIKDREALAALDPFGDTMLLTTLHWPDEIRATDELDLGDEKYEFKPAELAMAKQLVSAMTAEFDPSQYKDEYRDALMKVIEAKVEGTEPEEVEQPEEGGNLVDLMAALDPFADTMLLTTLHWPDEVRSTSELDLPDEDYDFKPAELAMARQLVSAMTGEFNPAEYKDEYRDALMGVIESKIEGHEVKAPEPVEEGGKLIDLMAALEASVNAAKAARAGDKPVSVAEAKKARAGKAATEEKAATAKAKTAAKAHDDAEAEAAAPKTRKRKTA